MTSNQLATYAAIGVAVVALYVVTRKPGAMAGGQATAAGKRSDDLRKWFDTTSQQWALFGGQGLPTSLTTSASLTGL